MKYKKIKLTQGKVAIIDCDDFELVSQYKWYFHISNKKGKGYACHTLNRKNKKNIHLFLHNLIMNPPKGKEVDHINRNKLDNRRKNLRIVNRSQNCHNRPKYGKSKYRGVYYKSYISKYKTKPFMAYIASNSIRLVIGFFSTAKEAALAYDKKALELYGEYAQLNFPKKNG